MDKLADNPTKKIQMISQNAVKALALAWEKNKTFYYIGLQNHDAPIYNDEKLLFS